MKRFWLAIQWLAGVIAGLIRIIVQKPQATPQIAKYVIANLLTLPARLRHKTNISEERVKFKEKLDETTSFFANMPTIDEDSIDLAYFKDNINRFPTRWTPLYIIIRTLKAKAIIETGVSEGESTSHILKALDDNGMGLLHSIDLPAAFYFSDKGNLHIDFPSAERTGCLVPAELRSRWKLSLGKSSDLLPGSTGGTPRDRYLPARQRAYL